MKYRCCSVMRRRRSKISIKKQCITPSADEDMQSATIGPGWKARGDRKPKEKRVPFNRPTPQQVYEALPFVRRYFMYWMKHTFDKEKLFINTFQPLKHKPYYGVPCGGIGCGAIGRDFRGGFCKFSLRPGLVEHKVDVVAADQFILSPMFDELLGNCHRGISGFPKEICFTEVCSLVPGLCSKFLISEYQRFDPSKSGASFWCHLQQTGDVPEKDEECSPNSREMAVAVCNRFKLGPSDEKVHNYALSWDMPKVHFGSVARSYHRRYTRFFQASETGAVADSLCVRALRMRESWETKIEDWQNPVLMHTKLPDWYKSAIFNELYFITDGGTVWFEFDEHWAEHETHLSEYTKQRMKTIGRFGYLESWEYRMVNTYDVHFYASYALAELWPQLELAIQSEFTDQVYHSIEKPTRFHMEGDWANVKTASRIPHDLGNPADEPWIATNAYVMHDTGKWKDLNMKYVLISWRDYVVLSEKHSKFLFHTWPAVKTLMLEALENWDQDGDGMIENFGKADQTYDAWQMEGSVSPEMANDVLPNEMVRSSLETIYNLNVCRFGNGSMGAVNADEMWTGVTYAVASLLIQQGEVEKAFHTASGSYLTCFERAGLQYQTPEALYESRFYRAIGYMRPLSIWAMQWSLKRHCGIQPLKELQYQ
ncbi:unnamed protein product [Caenorhabditis sp. 36 PRJEB53466]|nr:unnamed protein product [Caenorhabditis sp. 36 PRJEB53466]